MPQVAGMGGSNAGVAGLVHECVVALYVGLLAIYYFTREKYIRAYLAETPAWIVNLQQAGVVI